jgi:Mg-chelatase subunit ChlD
MASRVRIARVDPAPFDPLSHEHPPTAALHERIQSLVRRHLPPVTWSLLAAPSPASDRGWMEWYSDIPGQPTSLRDLPEHEQARVRALLNDRLAAVRGLADRLPSLDPGAAELVEPLRQALAYPGDETVYVIGGQPVITFWGYRNAATGAVAGLAPVVGAGMAVAAGNTPAGTLDETGEPPGRAAGAGVWSRALLAVPLLALLALLAVGVLRGWGLRWPPWGPDYVALLQTAQDEGQSLEARLDSLQQRLAEAQTVCGLREQLRAALREEGGLLARADAAEAQLAAGLELCPLRRDLAQARRDGDDLATRLRGLEGQLAGHMEACRAEALRLAEVQRQEAQAEAAKRKAAAAARRERAEAARAAEPEPEEPRPRMPEKMPEKEKMPPEPRRAARPDGLPPCPGERPPEEAPDVALVMDASGSMRRPASERADAIRQVLSAGGLFGALLADVIEQTQGGETRLQAAKRAVPNVVKGLPSDVDVGLVVLEDCPRASNYGYYSGAQRNQLFGRVGRLQPMRGTPLADGLAEAGSMVDGVNAPAVVVVVSDGEDSCGVNPCAVARMLKARKPKLTINVVDIVGNGAANCLAQLTGGKILKPESGMQFESKMRQAVKEAEKPAHCR